MNTAKLKAYAPQARKEFIKAVTERANYYGIFSDDHIEPIEFKGDVAIIGERAFTQSEGELREKLVNRIKRDRFELVMRACAYTWFNRFVALRYMELHDYLEHGYRVLSNNGGSDIPEILDHAADADFQGLDKDKVVELRLAGNKDNELYRLLIVAQCNALHKAMPFLFERIDSETELLLPDNLLHSNSPIRKMVTEISEEDWNDVEIIGWIYQFYISEKKDEVIGKVVKSEDIPAATQLFTPNWIVKYMVQNTLGRMWLATYPDSPLKDKMEYYIEPAEQEPEVHEQLDSITPKELKPEEITFLDPACGSGHILVEAYDIYKEIYLERGYRTKDIPRLILEKNLYGLDIDDRAAQLACFALLMTARRDDRRILSRDHLRLNVMPIIETKGMDKKKIAKILSNKQGEKHIGIWVRELIDLFEDGKTFGSLISVPSGLVEKLNEIKREIESDEVGNDSLFEYLDKSHLDSIKPVNRQAQVLAKKYDCVVANPPYMGFKYICQKLKKHLNEKFKGFEKDLFSAFIVQNKKFAKHHGQLGFMSPFVWMFISTYENLRKVIIDDATLSTLIQLEYSGFAGATVPICTFTFTNHHNAGYKSSFIRLSKFRGAENQAPKALYAINNKSCGWFYLSPPDDFHKIPNSPIAYWVSENLKAIFQNNPKLEEFGDARIGLQTGDNARFLREWFEVDFLKIGFNYESRSDVLRKGGKWFPYNKGGRYRKWSGNQNFVVNWEHDGKEIIDYQLYLNSIKPASSKMGIANNSEFYFKPSLSWSKVSSGEISFRYFPEGYIFDVAGTSFFPKKNFFYFLGLLNSKVIPLIVAILSPTLNFEAGAIRAIPVVESINLSISENIKKLIDISKNDWDAYEVSWDFTSFPLLKSVHQKKTLQNTYNAICTFWQETTNKMLSFEKDNNRIFIKAYGLEGELTPDVHINEISLSCNPYFRYGSSKSKEELETVFLNDIIKELISYTIGCMMGRYSLEHPGLIYAHSGNKDFDASKYKTFPADNDGIIPIMDQEWFSDDATNRFVEFLKVTWSPETLDENLKFVADSLKSKNNETPVDTIRRYLSTNFFKDHIRTYKKRPIYWSFSSGKHKAFECLVYLHRYNESTLSRIRSTYVTPLQGNFSARLEFLQNEKDAAATASAQRKIQKEIDVLRKKQNELSAFDDELRHYADMKISLDLDDGVKGNYGKFGNLLAQKKIITG